MKQELTGRSQRQGNKLDLFNLHVVQVPPSFIVLAFICLGNSLALTLYVGLLVGGGFFLRFGGSSDGGRRMGRLPRGNRASNPSRHREGVESVVGGPFDVAVGSGSGTGMHRERQGRKRRLSQDLRRDRIDLVDLISN